MNANLIRKAAALPARQLHLIGAGLVLVACAALWFYALRAPATALRTIRAEHARLKQAGSDPQLLAAQLAALDTGNAALAHQLGNAPAGLATPLLLQLIGDVSKLATAHHVKLLVASPAAEQKTLVFEQFGIDAEASGPYASLLAWLGAIEQSRPDIAIDSFQMGVAEAPGQVHIKLRIAVYRPLESTP
jgi:uncharacterized membrane protein